MGLKVVKCSDEAYAEICRVASQNKTYLSDAVDLIVFRKVDDEGKKIEPEDKAKPKGKARRRAKPKPKVYTLVP